MSHTHTHTHSLSLSLSLLVGIVQALEQAIPGVSHAFSILVLVLSIYAILGVSFFGEPCPELYGTFGAAFLTNFQVCDNGVVSSPLHLVP